jgi:amino-acid N-acetyltransferase
MPLLRGVQPADIHDVKLLLESCNLPGAGIEDQFADAFILAEHESEIIGVAGIEKYGDYGLLRSVAVKGPYRGRSVGRLLVKECVARARRKGISKIYLLTTDAQAYFEALGFTILDRERVPYNITKSHEYASICPQTATVMVLLSPRVGPFPRANRRSGE